MDVLNTETILSDAVQDLTSDIPNENGKLLVSLAKKKIGGTNAAKNKHKPEGVSKPRPKATLPCPKIKVGLIIQPANMWVYEGQGGPIESILARTHYRPVKSPA